MISSMEATSNLSQSMLDIRSQFHTMSQFMADLAQSLETAVNRRGGIPPEVNLTSPNETNHNGSESSSCLGDPSQAANPMPRKLHPRCHQSVSGPWLRHREVKCIMKQHHLHHGRHQSRKSTAFELLPQTAKPISPMMIWRKKTITSRPT